MSQKKILIADDEEDVKLIVQLFLESRGYSVVTAYDGLDAIAMAESENPDLILLDIMMPVIDGLEVARRLKNNEKTRHIPIIMLSAAQQDLTIKKGMDAGAVGYMVKPFEPSKLEELVRKHLS
jgi:two-component system, OmpR family, alkaline phosphatase synthesis response regulator PhoP